MRKYILCRALSGHAWEIVGAIAILTSDVRRITFQCARCGSLRADKWDPKGKQLTRTYQHEKLYRTLLDEQDRAGARALILSEGKTYNETDNPRLRLVHGKRASRGKSHRNKRPKDKRRVA